MAICNAGRVSVDPNDWRRRGQEKTLMEAVLERRTFKPPDQENLRAWRSPSRGVVVEGFHLPSDGIFAQIKDWEEVTPPYAWDHEHCEFCWVTFAPAAKLAGQPQSDSAFLAEGYVTVDRQTEQWICNKCFADFRDEFKWSVRTAQ